MQDPDADTDQELSRERKLRQQAEAKNGEYRFFLQTLIDSLPDILFIKDPQGVYVACNKACARIWGLETVQVVGHTDQELARHNEVDFLAEKDGEALKRSNPIHLQEMVRYPDGGIVHLEVTKSAYRDANGATSGIIGVARDVGERRLLHEELKAIRRQLSHLSRSRSELMNRIGSEIRGPLNAINGLTHLMLRTPLETSQQHYLKKIRGSTRNLLATTSDILDYSRLENHKLDLEATPFLLDQVLDNLRDLLQGEAEQKGIDLEILIAQETPRCLRGDPARLGQILYNLTNNGIKFTHRGKVRVSVTPEEQGENRVSLKFVIKDSGAGMPPEQIQALFDNPADQLGTANKGLKGGGFGLAICQRLTELMGGRIQVASEPGFGSTFSFSAVFNRANPEELKQGAVAVDLTGKRALLIDGDQASRNYLWNQLTGLGMEVSPAASVRRALERLDELRYEEQGVDLLLIDWRLPDSNGLEAAQQLRQDELANTPCLLMTTAYGRNELATPARDAGIDGFLVKPVDERQLRQLISQAIQPAARSPDHSLLIGEHSGPVANRLAGKNVLLVEDDLINREVARELLKDAGLQVTTAQSGREAIDELEHTSFDLVLMDIQMPELDGLAATRMIRLDERFRELPIIAMTVHARDEDREECLRVGMNDHVIKPFDPDELYGVLAHWLNPERDQRGTAPHPPAPEQGDDERLPTLPGIDLDLALKLTGGKIDVLLRMLRLFRRNYTQVPAKMKNDLKEGRLLGVFRSAHSLKSATRYIGATHLARLAEVVEQAARDGDPNGVSEAMVAFEQDFLSLLDAIDVLDGDSGGEDSQQ
jgi:two-component system sensor histidine kinase/response regulator